MTMQPGKRGRQLQTPADVGRAARRVILEVDTDVMTPDKAMAILAGLELIYSVMQRDSGATHSFSTGQSANR